MESPTTATTAAAFSTGVDDMISNLPDDLLLRILAFLPAAADAVRTSAVSLRWRHIWREVAAIRFNVGDEPPEDCTEAEAAAAARRLVAAATATIARRASEGPDVEDVELSFIYCYEESDAFSFIDGPHFHAAVKVQLGQEEGVVAAEEIERVEDEGNNNDDDDAGEEEEEKNVIIAELPCSARLAEMSLTLRKAILKVPAAGAGAFEALTDILLSHVRLDTGGDDSTRLSHLLSSSCSPKLRRVQLKHIEGLSLLRVAAAGTLAELRLRDLSDLHALDVDAPGLHALSVQECSEITEAARISAPRLRELEFVNNAKRLQLDGAASVRRITKLFIDSHRLRLRENDDEDYYNNS